MGVLSWSPLAGGWLSGNFGTGKENKSRRAERLPARYDMDDPTNEIKLLAVDQLAELAAKAGHSLPEMAVAFVLSHPGVTSAIIGPRTMEQLTGVLVLRNPPGGRDPGPHRRDRPTGDGHQPADSGWAPPWLSEPALRRR